MKRTRWLQETKQMRFEEAYYGWRKRRLTQEEAALILGVSGRSFRRYIDRFEENGLEGLADKRLTQASHRRAPVDEVVTLVYLYTAAIRAGMPVTFTTCTSSRAEPEAIPR